MEIYQLLIFLVGDWEYLIFFYKINITLVQRKIVYWINCVILAVKYNILCLKIFQLKLIIKIYKIIHLFYMWVLHIYIFHPKKAVKWKVY